MKAAKGKASQDMWPFYTTVFSDALEAANSAPRTIQTYCLAVEQLGDYLRAQGVPADPMGLTRSI